MSIRKHLRVGTALALTSILTAGCHPMTTPTGSLREPVDVSPHREKGSATLHVRLSPEKGLKTQFVDLMNAKSIFVSVAGAGITDLNNYDAFSRLTEDPDPNVYNYDSNNGIANFGTPDTTTGIRQATLTMKWILSGNRRIFRVLVRDNINGGGNDLKQLMGVGDVTPNATTPDLVQVDEWTTITAKVFQRLLRINPAKAMTVNITGVKHYVERVMRKGLSDEIHYTLIQDESLDKISTEIVTNNWAAPLDTTPLPAYLAPPAYLQGSARVLVRDGANQPVNQRMILYLNDPISSPLTVEASASPAAQAFFPKATTGNWTATAVIPDLNRTLSIPVTINDDSTTTVTITTPIQGVKTVGAVYDPNLYGYTDYLHSSISRLRNPGTLAVRDETINGLPSRSIYFWDRTNRRIRKLYNLNGEYIIATVAGNGLDEGQAGNVPIPATGTVDPLQASIDYLDDVRLTITNNGTLYFKTFSRTATQARVYRINPGGNGIIGDGNDPAVHDDTLETVYTHSWTNFNIQDIKVNPAGDQVYFAFNAYNYLPSSGWKAYIMRLSDQTLMTKDPIPNDGNTLYFNLYRDQGASKDYAYYYTYHQPSNYWGIFKQELDPLNSTTITPVSGGGTRDHNNWGVSANQANMSGTLNLIVRDDTVYTAFNSGAIAVISPGATSSDRTISKIHNDLGDISGLWFHSDGQLYFSNWNYHAIRALVF